MDNKEVKELLERYDRGMCTPAERAFIETWYLNQLPAPLETPIAELSGDLDQIQGQLNEYISPPKIKLWPRLGIAASIVLCFGIGLYFYQQQGQSAIGHITAKNDILPGKNKATLTLADGSRLELSDATNGKLAEQSGMSITKTADGKVVYAVAGKAIGGKNVKTALNTLSTARGEQYQVVLPDGTKVWLNAASSLKFPVSFSGSKDRSVALNGEAYFEVAKDKSHPFIVKTAQQQLMVLGTHFNINSYADESGTLTTLLEGSVKINGQTVLKPGEQARLTENGKIEVSAANLEEAIGWKNGFFLFDKDDLPTVMRQISRWYDISVKYEGEIPKASFDGKVYRNINLSKALEVLKYANVKFRLEGKTIIIMP